MNKLLIVITSVLILAVAGFYYLRSPATEERDDGGLNMMVPAPGEEGKGVEEMIVNGHEDGVMMEEMMEEGGMMMPEKKVFNISGKNFSFSSSEIRVRKGDKVVINFESADGFHDWTIDGFDAGTSRVNTGGKSSVEFTADKTGEFEFHCSVGNHSDLGMHGKLIVE